MCIYEVKNQSFAKEHIVVEIILKDEWLLIFKVNCWSKAL